MKKYLILSLIVTFGSFFVLKSPSYTQSPALECKYFVKDLDVQYQTQVPTTLDLEKLIVSDPLNNMKPLAIKLGVGKVNIIYNEDLDKFYISIHHGPVLNLIPNYNYTINNNWILTYRAKGSQYFLGEEVAIDPIDMDTIHSTYALFFAHRTACQQLLNRRDERLKDIKLKPKRRSEALIEYNLNDKIKERQSTKPQPSVYDTIIENTDLLDFEDAKEFAKSQLEDSVINQD